jgi:hypothetical protein
MIPQCVEKRITLRLVMASQTNGRGSMGGYPDSLFAKERSPHSRRAAVVSGVAGHDLRTGIVVREGVNGPSGDPPAAT